MEALTGQSCAEAGGGAWLRAVERTHAGRVGQSREVSSQRTRRTEGASAAMSTVSPAPAWVIVVNVPSTVAGDTVRAGQSFRVATRRAVSGA